MKNFAMVCLLALVALVGCGKAEANGRRVRAVPVVPVRGGFTNFQQSTGFLGLRSRTSFQQFNGFGGFTNFQQSTGPLGLRSRTSFQQFGR